MDLVIRVKIRVIKRVIQHCERVTPGGAPPGSCPDVRHRPISVRLHVHCNNIGPLQLIVAIIPERFMAQLATNCDVGSQNQKGTNAASKMSSCS